jgi:hypothetical protein
MLGKRGSNANKKGQQNIFPSLNYTWQLLRKLQDFFSTSVPRKKLIYHEMNLFIWSSFVRVEKYREDQNLTDSSDISLSFSVKANGTNLQVYLPTED